MPHEITIQSGTAESAEVVRRVQRAIRLCEQLNRLGYHEMDAIRAEWAELTGQPVDETFHLIPPVRTEHGLNIRIGRDVFINHGCTLMDIGGIDIGDEVMIGPNASLITSGHPLDPALRRKQIVAAPIVVERNVWIGASALIMHGVTVGADAVVAAGAVVTSDVPPATVVGGVPARVLRSVYDEPRNATG